MERESTMQISELVIETPYYVLMYQKQPLGPAVTDPESLVIFGFSDKVPYDNFCCESALALTPYPLVKGYLRGQIGLSDEAGATQRCVKLVVLDAPGPRESSIHAVTMEAVLEAQENQATHMTPTHHLAFSSEAGVYRLKETSN